MRWHHVRLHHARNACVDLYVHNARGVVEALVGSERDQACFSAVRVVGEVKAISFDQHRKSVPWEMVPLPEYCRSPEMDSRHNEMIPGHEPGLDEIKYDIANAMNRTLRDRGFSKFVRRHLIGHWATSESELNFRSDGSYSVSGLPVPFPFPPPTTGRWSVSSNMLWLMSGENDRGIRVAIVSVDELELRFHGRDGALFYVYEKRA